MKKRFILEKFVKYDSDTNTSHYKRMMQSNDLITLTNFWVDGYRIIDSLTGKELTMETDRVTA